MVYDDEQTEQTSEVTTGQQTIGELIRAKVAESVTAASAYEVTLPDGIKINIINTSDPRLSQVAPEGTIVTPKSSAKAG